MFELKPDFEEVLNRFEAWWECEILDRPLVSMTFPVPDDKKIPVHEQQHATLKERWLDTEYIVEKEETSLRNTVHFADALPVVIPNLGPEIFSAFYGCDLEFGERTSWSSPILFDWSEESLEQLQINNDSFYFKKIVEMTEALIEAGQDKFIVGYTDLHGGGDAIAAFRDPQELLFDTIEHPDEIKKLCDRITTDFIKVYDIFHKMLSSARMPSTSWLKATCKGKYHIPSNDFSCMISEESFEDLFIPGIIRECKHMDRCIYHLDGPQALRYLDCLLEIPEIHAIQWVPGAGQDYWADWIEVYQKIQSKNKAMCIAVPFEDLELLFESLAPEGIWISGVRGVNDMQQAETALEKISGWTKKKG